LVRSRFGCGSGDDDDEYTDAYVVRQIDAYLAAVPTDHIAPGYRSRLELRADRCDRLASSSCPTTNRDPRER
jgi:hypothetical protein